ncbi:MAG: SWF/SNF helicase family protein [Fibrobacter sp.]|nr:SWF/SNF helicase family protein [Fibrobacter sp.]
MKTVCGAQTECIKAIRALMANFLSEGKPEGYTKVFPLSIPTGWGKTRVAIQSILKSAYKKSVNVVLWPQNQGHVKRVWQRPGDWMGDGKKKHFFVPHWRPLKNPVRQEDFLYEFYKKEKKEIEVNDYKEASFNPYRHIKFFSTSNRFGEFNGDTRVLRNNLGDSPIFFIIDEWHSFDLINDYREYLNGVDPSPSNAERFWRQRLLYGNCKKNSLFVLLLSATPIASAEAMDKIFDTADSFDDNADFEDECAQEAVKSDLELFNVLTQINTPNKPHKAHLVFPVVLQKRSEDLRKVQEDFKENRSFKRLKKRFPACDFADDYVRLGKRIAKSEVKFPYQREQSVFATDSIKVRCLADFIGSCVKERHLLIFCHHLDSVAKELEKKLKAALGKNSEKLEYLSNKLSASTINAYIDDFNDEKGTIRYLIVTDKFSQGIDLQKTNAWILHYELAWNPIRIIQRFGRVWRINNPGAKKEELSKPLSFYIPFTFSSEEEQINRLRRRWKTLSDVLPENDKLMKPVDFDIALGIRITPESKEI